MKARWLIPGIALAALLQTAALGKMVLDRAALLRDGREVVLETGMIDPRDLFRGHYTRIDLAISRLDPRSLAPYDPPAAHGDPVYVTLAPGNGADGFWRAVAATATRPDTDAPVILGRYDWSNEAELFLTFPFQRYYAPETRALALEDTRNAAKLGLIVALAPDGTGAVKGITVAGEALYIEPLF